MLYSVPHSLCVHVQEVHHYYTITHSLCATTLKTYALKPVVIQASSVCYIENEVVRWAHSCYLSTSGALKSSVAALLQL